MSAASAPERLLAALEGLGARALEARDGLPGFELEVERVRPALERLRSQGFDQVTLITAVDRFPAHPRFEVVWQLYSYGQRQRVRLKCRVGAEEPSVPSACDLWPGASFMERECWDLFGIRFGPHPDLRRLMMPDGYDHHPLRKDFPHKGIEPDRLYRQWDRGRRARFRSEAGS